MKKICLVLACTTLGAASIHAQEKGKFKLGIGASSTAFINGYSGVGTLGLGLDVKAEYRLSEHFSAFAKVGVSNFFGRTVKTETESYKGSSMQYIPALVGINYLHKSGFLVGAGAGITTFGGYGGGNTGFAYTLHAGYSAGKFDFLADYTRTTADGGFSCVGLKVYYNIFKTKK